MLELVLVHLTIVISWVFSRKRGFTDYSNLEDDFELKKKLAISLKSTQRLSSFVTKNLHRGQSHNLESMTATYWTAS